MKFTHLFFLLLPVCTFSQNLVMNPSFEETKECSYLIGQFGKNVQDWQSPTFGSTDLFNNCSKAQNRIPNNYQGNQFVKFGENYAGCYFYSNKNYREYIQGNLLKKLEKDKKYVVSFYISLSEKSDLAIENIDFVLSENKFSFLIDQHVSSGKLKHIKGDYQLFEIENNRAYTNKEQWIKITKEIVASGYESYITIGNFKSNSKTETLQKTYKLNDKIAYYYIDMVAVEPSEKNRQELVFIEEPQKIASLELDKPYVLQNIFFDFDKDVLLEESKKALLGLVEIMSKCKNNVTILGHTDNVGAEDYNKELATKRAKAVVDFLIEEGIDKGRLQHEGHGSEKPIASNETEVGREQNRRVEFIIQK